MVDRYKETESQIANISSLPKTRLIQRTLQNINLKVDTDLLDTNDAKENLERTKEDKPEELLIVPTEPKISDKKFIEELSSENIEALALEVIGGNGQTIKF